MNEPLLRVIGADELSNRRSRAVDDATLAAARTILDDLDARGDVAALEHAHRLGDIREGEPHLLAPSDLKAARDRLPRAQRDVLERTASRIRAFADAQRACLRDLSFPIPGGEAGHTLAPVQTAGCYAPGGRYPLPSSVLMTAVTARAAGVREVWVASPRPTDATLAAAAIAEADGLLAIGGVQSIGAMARGLLGVPRCDMIVGPGNRWVTAAKQLVSGEVGIDMLAGPSELLILADDSADPSHIAADLLAQAEHDVDAVPMLVTTSAAIVQRVERELQSQLKTLPTAPMARTSLHNGFAIVAATVEQALLFANRIGPEHLEIMFADAAAVARGVRNAGAVFLGARTPEALGDYGAGPNHVLPTGGTSRFRAGLSVFSFIRARTWLRIDDSSMALAAQADAVALARIENLEAHARSVEIRAADRPKTP